MAPVDENGHDEVLYQRWNDHLRVHQVEQAGHDRDAASHTRHVETVSSDLRALVAAEKESIARAYEQRWRDHHITEERWKADHHSVHVQENRERDAAFAAAAEKAHDHNGLIARMEVAQAEFVSRREHAEMVKGFDGRISANAQRLDQLAGATSGSHGVTSNIYAALGALVALIAVATAVISLVTR